LLDVGGLVDDRGDGDVRCSEQASDDVTRRHWPGVGLRVFGLGLPEGLALEVPCAVEAEIATVGDIAAYPVDTATKSIPAAAAILVAAFTIRTLPTDWQGVTSLG
jgi:hypothetical protein